MCSFNKSKQNKVNLRNVCTPIDSEQGIGLDIVKTRFKQQEIEKDINKYKKYIVYYGKGVIYVSPVDRNHLIKLIILKQNTNEIMRKFF